MCWKAQTRQTGRDSDNYRSENRCLGRRKTVGNGFLLALVSARRIEAWTDPISCKVCGFYVGRAEWMQAAVARSHKEAMCPASCHRDDIYRRANAWNLAPSRRDR